MIQQRAILLSCAFLGSFLLLAQGAHAQVPSLFATFGQASSNPAFQFQSSGGNGSLGLASPLAVNFQYQTENGFSPNIGQNIMATVSMSSLTSGAAYTDAGLLVQPLANIEMRFTSALAAPDSGDLLRVFLTTGNLIGAPGGQTAVLTATQGGSGGSIVNFASDYLDFSAPLVNKNFAVSFTSVDPVINLGNDGNLRAFSATATGNFGSAPKPRAIPEPASCLLIGFGLAGLLARRRR